MTERFVSRRRLLAASAAVAGLTGLTGCSDAETDDADTTVAETDSTSADSPVSDRTPTDGSEGANSATEASGDGPVTTTGTTTSGRDRTDTPATPETPDLREANVVGVEIEQRDGGYRFSVTLYHDDDGEDGYANWWQVERLDGEQLGRRELLHAHSTDPFTRSETISVPDDVSCVVVRGHDQTHEYGGRAMLVALPSGETATLEQGADRISTTEADCP